MEAFLPELLNTYSYHWQRHFLSSVRENSVVLFHCYDQESVHIEMIYKKCNASYLFPLELSTDTRSAIVQFDRIFTYGILFIYMNNKQNLACCIYKNCTTLQATILIPAVITCPIIGDDAAQKTVTFTFLMVKHVLTDLLLVIFLFLSDHPWDPSDTDFVISQHFQHCFQCIEADIWIYTTQNFLVIILWCMNRSWPRHSSYCSGHIGHGLSLTLLCSFRRSCRICQLHLYRGVRPPSHHEGPCWPCVATHDA